MPVVISFYYCYKTYNLKQKTRLYFYLIALFFSLFFKFSSGFEYTSTVLIAMVTPLFYYWLNYKLSFRRLLSLFLIFSTLGVLAFLSSMLLLGYLIYNYLGGSLDSTIDIMLMNIARRTYNISGAELVGILQNSLMVPVYQVVLIYLTRFFGFQLQYFLF